MYRATPVFTSPGFRVGGKGGLPPKITQPPTNTMPKVDQGPGKRSAITKDDPKSFLRNGSMKPGYSVIKPKPSKSKTTWKKVKKLFK
jgi:hypothetical protein